MKKVRIIPRLDVKGPNVVKGIQLEGLRVVGKPAELARKYYAQGADEIIYMDIVASLYDRNNLSHIVEETSEKDVFIPITVGGGIRTIEDIGKILRSGADKVAINTAAVKNPSFIKEAARAFGSSTIVLSIEAKRVSSGKWEAYIENGRQKTGFDVLEWAKEAIRFGAGELLITSVDRDGTRKGYDKELIDAIAEISSVPVVVSGGAGKFEDIEDCLGNKMIDGISLATLLHYNDCELSDLKDRLSLKYPDKINLNYRKQISNNTGKVNARVSIIDYNLSNMRSVKNAFRHIGADAEFIHTPREVLNAEYLVLPGVGSFEEGVRNLKDKKLDRAILEYVSSNKPLLGICLGMQLLMSKSYEFGEHEGLNIIEGEVLPFKGDPVLAKEGYKVPHVGWNSLKRYGNWDDTILGFSGEDDIDAYFVHSFYVVPVNQQHALALTDYFGNEFCSVVKKGNVYGCQFHPEKSGETGLAILREFINIHQSERVFNAR